MKTQFELSCRHILMSLTLVVTTVVGGATTYASPTDQLHEYLNPFRAQSRETHLYREITDADAALANRLQLIENAQRSIILDVGIIRSDEAGRAILRALLKKAVSMRLLSYVRDEKTLPKTVLQNPKTGSPFQIRLLVDFQSSAKVIDRHVAKSLMDAGVEVRYFHVPIVGFFENYRSHRNMMIVDDQLCISGGEISDNYFPKNQQARDLCLQGKITRAALKNFHAFWYLKDGTYEGHFAEIPKAPKAPEGIENESYVKTPARLENSLRAKKIHFAEAEARARELLAASTEQERKIQFRRQQAQAFLDNTQWKSSNSVSLLSDLLGSDKTAERVSATFADNNGVKKLFDMKCTGTMDLSFTKPELQSDLMICINDKNSSSEAPVVIPAKPFTSKVDLSAGTLAEIQARYQFKPEKRDCVESNLDPFDPGAYMKDGPDKGICADTSDLRVPVILNETPDTITIANFRHARRFWVATINKNAIEEVYFQNGTFDTQPFFFTTAAHSQIRMIMNKKSPILLQEQRLGSKEVQYIDAFVISAEPYNVRNGVPRDEMRIITRFVSQLDRATDEMGFRIRKFTDQVELKLNLEQRTHLLKTAIYRSTSQGYTRYYTVWRSSCAVEAIKTIAMAFPPKSGVEASAMITILDAIDPVIGPTTKVLKALGLVDEESANYTLEDEYSSPLPFMNEMRRLTKDRREQKKLDLLINDANNGVYDPASNLELKFYN